MSQTSVQPPGERVPQRRALPRRQRRSFARRLMQSVKSWARDTFSREQFISGLKSLAWVAPMTVIIWIYAEREQTGQQTSQFRLEAENADPNRIVELSVLGPDGKRETSFIIRADLVGPQARVEHVRGQLDGGTALPIDIPPDLPPGRTTLPNLLIANADLFVKEGITVKNQQPSQIDVFIDPIVEAPDVRVVLKPTIKTLEMAAFTPATVKVKGPKSALDAARAAGKLLAYADVNPTKDPGQQQLNNVPLSMPIDNPHISLSSATVSAVVTVKATDVEGTIDSVPVAVTLPPIPFWNKYQPVYQTDIHDLKVTGPLDGIRQIKSSESDIKPSATLDLRGFKPPPGVPTGHYRGKLQYDFGSSGVKESPGAETEWPFDIAER